MAQFCGLILSVCAGALSEWLADHPVMINNVLPLVLQALGNPELSISSVSTLKKICRECKYDLPPYAANIVAVSQVGPGCRQIRGTWDVLCAHTLPLAKIRQGDAKQQLRAFSLVWETCPSCSCASRPKW